MEAEMKLLDGIYVVHWRDANARGGWDSRSEYLKHDVAEVVTTGFMLKRDKKSVTIVSTQCKDGPDCNGAISIPIEWCASIKKVASLAPARKKLDVRAKARTGKTRKAGLDNPRKKAVSSGRRKKPLKND